MPRSSCREAGAPGGLGHESADRVLTSRDRRRDRAAGEEATGGAVRAPIGVDVRSRVAEERAARAPVVGASRRARGWPRPSGRACRASPGSETLETREMTEGVSLGLLRDRRARPPPPGCPPLMSPMPKAVQRRHTEVRGESSPAPAAARTRRARRSSTAKPSAARRVASAGSASRASRTLRRPPQERGFEQAPALPARLADPELARGHVDEGGSQGAPAPVPERCKARRKLFAAPSRYCVSVSVPGVMTRTTSRRTSFLPLARRLHLLAHRHLATGADQPGDVAVGGVMGNARHGDGPLPLLARGEGDLEQARALVGVLEEELVEVAEAEEQEVVGVTLLELPVLQHHWSQRGGQRGGQRSAEETAGTARRPMTRQGPGEARESRWSRSRAARRRS